MDPFLIKTKQRDS